VLLSLVGASVEGVQEAALVLGCVGQQVAIGSVDLPL
jgi:hypothetical protein